MPTVSALYVYPVKSCAGIAVDNFALERHGLQWDRHWMVIDAQGRFVSQREYPAMATLRTALTEDRLELSAAHATAPLHLPLTAPEGLVRRKVTVWDDTMVALDEGDAAAQWFSDALGTPVRLVRFADDAERLASDRWTGETISPVQFADGFPLLVTSETSLDELNRRMIAKGAPAIPMTRFRPNIVLRGIDSFEEDFIDTLSLGTDDEPVLRLVKPCARCPITTIDQQTGTRDAAFPHEPLDTLTGWRSDPRVNGGLTFGQNAIVMPDTHARISVGDEVSYSLRFDD